MNNSSQNNRNIAAVIIGFCLVSGLAVFYPVVRDDSEISRFNPAQQRNAAQQTNAVEQNAVEQDIGSPPGSTPPTGGHQIVATAGQGSAQAPKAEFLGIPVVRVREVALDGSFLRDPLPMPGESLAVRFFDDVSLTAEVRDRASVGAATESLTATLPQAVMGRLFLARTNGQVLAVANFPGQNKQFRLVYDAALGKHFAVEVDVSRLLAESPVDSVIPLDPGPPVANHQKLIPKSDRPAAHRPPFGDAAADIADAETYHDEPPVAVRSSGVVAFEDPEQDITIDLMVVYTPAALAQAGNQANMQNAIAVAIAESNDVFFNSLTGVSLRLVHSAQTTYTESGNGQLSDELSRLSSQSDAYMDEIHALRDTHQADIVQLVSHENGGGGIAYQLTSFSGSPSWAFSVSNYNSLVGVLTPVHEIGHNMGCGHAIDQNYQAGPGIASYAGGWHWHPVAGQSGYCTVMAYTSGTYYADALSHSRVPYFSNPDIFLDGLAVGDTDDGDNARAIRLTKRVMAEYREGENFVPVVNTNLGLSVRPAVPTTIMPTDLQASDANGRDTPEELTFTLVSVPGKGLLKKSGTQLLAGHTFTQQDIDDGIITFTGGSGQTGTDTFVFNLKDSANAGVEGVVVTIQFDTAPPVLTGTSPAHNSGTQPRSSSLQLIFGESVLKGGTGTLVLRRQSDNSVVESVNITSSQVAVSGNSVIYTPSVTLDYDTGYYLEIEVVPENWTSG